MPAARAVSSSPSPAAPIEDEPTAYRGRAADRTGFWEVFKSPSGNIRCGFSSVDDTDWVSCFISDHTWKAPHCPYPGVVVIELATEGDAPPDFECDGTSDPGQAARVLAYGHSLQEIFISCASEPGGMTCKNAKHGFTVSRAGFRFH